ncbi:MAG: hypothetical protein Fur0010_09870 [Bdellovibrio sp.]
MKSTFIFSFLLLPLLAHSATIGTIVQIKGDVLLYKRLMSLNDEIQVGDVITTGESSFVKIQLTDNTIVALGPSSELDFSKFKTSTEKRDSLYNLISGQLRIHVKKKTEAGEKIKVVSGPIAMGVRGTEILVNSYQAAGKATSDVALLSGSLEIQGANIKNFVMDAGSYFNSEDVLVNGSSALKKLTPDMLKKLNSDFLPNLKDVSGNVLDLGKSLGVGTMAAAGAIVGAISSSEERKVEKPVAEVFAASEKASQINHKGFEYNLANEPWDIRDNVMNFKTNMTKNECFYFFYKKLPGGGEEERFRRSRKCDEYEYDL